MTSKVITAAQAAEKIHDNAFIGILGVNVAGAPMEVIDAVADRFKSEGHPKNISVMHSGGHTYIRPLTLDGLLTTYYPGYSNIDPAIIDENRIPVYSISQGVGVQVYRAQANGMPYLTKAGLHTYIDPRYQGAAANAKAAEKPIVDVVEIGGEEYLHFKIPPVEVALVRATTADTDGNLTNEDESVKGEILTLAMAAHNNGGIVIAQVKNLVELGNIDAARVKVPGMLIDYIVVCTDTVKWHAQSISNRVGDANKSDFRGMTGFCRVPEETVPKHIWAPKGYKLAMARRGAAELRPGYICNVGLGTSDGVASVAYDEGVSDMYYMSNELGSIGGIIGGSFFFASAFNARAYMDHQDMFDFINGHGLDITFLGAAEIGEDGSVNVTRIGGRTNGAGGFISISSSTKRVVFMTTLTAGVKAEIGEGKLKITTEGKPVKFVKEVEQIGFNGKEATRKGQEVLYITERAVFKLIDGKVTLIEYAPGLDIERDIIAFMNFRPEVSPDVKPIPDYCFETGKIGLLEQWQRILDEKSN